MKIKEFQHQPVKPDTYEASMALNQLMRIGKHAIKLHNMIDDAAEMESWVAKKIDLAGDYVKKVYNYTEGEKAGLYDDGGMTESRAMIGDYAREIESGRIVRIVDFTPDEDGDIYTISYGEDQGENDVFAKDLKFLDQTGADQEEIGKFGEDAGEKIANMAQNMTRDEFISNADELGLTPEEAAEYYKKMQGGAYASKFEDAGEGHMSKSTLYHTAKYAIALLDMIKPGDDLEGWVQSKLNKAADYLQGVYNYEEYQKLNPYREELEPSILDRHAQVVQKNIDEILAKETEIDDIDTKPGMMRILSKRVNEVEKKLAKENRKNTDEAHGGEHTSSGRSMTKGEMNKREKIVKGMKKDKAGFKKRYGKDAEAVMYATATKQAMKDDEANESGIMYRAGVKKYGKKGMTAIQSAAGKGASHQEIGKIKDKYLKDEELDEGKIKDWAKSLAMAGVFVAGLAGVGSINDAINNSVPVVQAMNSALEMAQDAGNDELAKKIEQDIKDAKLRLDIGRDLNQVKYLQDKYSKFMPTEGLAYESKLAILLNQRLK